jgi:hypothetical protein
MKKSCKNFKKNLISIKPNRMKKIIKPLTRGSQPIFTLVSLRPPSSIKISKKRKNRSKRKFSLRKRSLWVEL